jgi:hypothetical protein
MGFVAGIVLILVAFSACAWGQGSAAGGEICSYEFLDLNDPCAVTDANGAPLLSFAAFDANDRVLWVRGFESVGDWYAYAASDPCLAGGKTEQIGWTLSGGNEEIFWPLQAIGYLCPEYRNVLESIESRPQVYDGSRRIWVTVNIQLTTGDSYLDLRLGTLFWNRSKSSALGGQAAWDDFPPLVALAHELIHTYQRAVEDRSGYTSPLQVPAMKYENLMRDAFRRKVPGNTDIRPRPGNAGVLLEAALQYLFDDFDWADWSARYIPLLDLSQEEE